MGGSHRLLRVERSLGGNIMWARVQPYYTFKDIIVSGPMLLVSYLFLVISKARALGRNRGCVVVVLKPLLLVHILVGSTEDSLVPVLHSIAVIVRLIFVLVVLITSSSTSFVVSHILLVLVLSPIVPPPRGSNAIPSLLRSFLAFNKASHSNTRATRITS